MTALVIKGFSGLRPALLPRLINENEAQTAKNVRLNNGAIRAMNDTTAVKTLTGTIQAIFRYGQTVSDTNYWLQFADDADVILSPVVSDQYKRIYWTTATSATPKYGPETVVIGSGTYPSASYILGVPKPTGKITASGTAAVTYTHEKRDYILVFTGSKNSAPSDPVTVTAVDGYDVKFTNLPVPSTSAGYTGKNLYRKLSTETTYKLVAALGTDVEEYTDSVKNADLGATYTVPTNAKVLVPTAPVPYADPLDTTSAAITRYYVYTTGGYEKLVNAGGDFGGTYNEYIDADPLSSAASISSDTTQQVTVSGLSKANSTSATYFRIFRRDTSTGKYFQVAQIPTSQTSWVDDLSQTDGAPYQGGYVSGTVAPPSAPSLSASASSATNPNTAPVFVYCATYINASGVESYRSRESGSVAVIDGTTEVTVRFPDASLGFVDFVSEKIATINLYRRKGTVSAGVISGTDADYKLVKALPASTTQYQDSASTTSIASNTALPSGSQGYSDMPSSGFVAAATVPDDVVPETRVYVFTYVTEYGEEGPSSDPSVSVDIDPAEAVNLTGLGTAPSGNYNITKKRIYRSSLGIASAAFQFVAEISVATATYSDTVKQADLGEILPSEGWIAAGTGIGDIPISSCHPGMKGLTLSANGIAGGFVGKTVHFSEPYLPHTYPSDFSKTTEWDIVGLASFGQSFAVLTKANPYIASGVDPSSMTMTKVPLPQGCVSKRSICAMADGVFYASPDGLVNLSNGGAQLVTKGLLTRDQWQAYNPSSMLIKQYNDKLYVFHSSGLLVFDFSGESATLTTFDDQADAAFYDPLQDCLFIYSGGSVLKWDSASTKKQYIWKSKLFTLPYPLVFSFGQVEATTYPVTCKVYADGVLKHTQTVTSRNPFRLPSGFRGKDWEIELIGSVDVFQVTVAQSGLEVKGL